MASYEKSFEDFEDALAGRKPTYLGDVNLRQVVPGSANMHMLENAALGISSSRDRRLVLDWARWYVHRPLHENEATTASESYRPAITLPSYALAGVALNGGDQALSRAFCDRTRADLCDLLLSIGCAPALEVQDEGTPGRRVILIGGGDPVPLAGNPDFPALLLVGKRGHVRADTASGHNGPFHYLYANAMRVMLAQLLGKPYNPSAGRRVLDCFLAIRRLWPTLPLYGFSPAELLVARAFAADPKRADLAAQIHAWAALYPSAEGRRRVRGTDGAIESIALELGSSSTGGVAINVQRADGVTFRTSCDNGGRGKGDIRVQRAEVVGNRIRCWYVDQPAVEMFVNRVVTREAWRSTILPNGGSSFIGAHLPGSPPAGPSPAQRPPRPAKPGLVKRTPARMRAWRKAVAEWEATWG
jgi:hypothetical protein